MFSQTWPLCCFLLACILYTYDTYKPLTMHVVPLQQDGALPTVHADILLEPLALTITPALTASMQHMLPEFEKLAAVMQGPAVTPDHVLARDPCQLVLLTVALHRLTVAWRAAEGPGHALAWDAGLTDVRVEVGVSDRDARVLVGEGGGCVWG